MGLRMSAARGCAGAQRGGAHGRSRGPRTGAQWCCARAHSGAVQERCVGLRLRCAKGRAWGGGGGPHHRLLASPPPRPSPGGYWCLGCKRDAWPHHRLLASRCKGGGGRLAWGCAGAQHGAPLEHSMGLCMSAAWGCA